MTGKARGKWRKGVLTEFSALYIYIVLLKQTSTLRGYTQKKNAAIYAAFFMTVQKIGYHFFGVSQNFS